MVNIKHNLKVSQDKQKICADQNKTARQFQVGDHVFLKVRPKKSSLNLGNCSKLATRYSGPFEVLAKIGPVAYTFPYLLALEYIMCFMCLY